MKRDKRRGAVMVGITAIILFLSAPRLFPLVLSWLHPEIIFRGPAPGKVLYLTIDDAPTEATPELLAVLQKNQVRATFFVIGDRVRANAQLSEIVAAGHSLGHHMQTTERCSQIPIDRFQAEFDFTDRLIRKYCKSTYFRPPSDFGTPEQLHYVRSKGYQPILGTAFPLDHWIQRPAILKSLLRWLTIPGGIIIMHDGAQRGRTTAQVLDEFLPLLKADGFTLDILPARTSGSCNVTGLGDVVFREPRFSAHVRNPCPVIRDWHFNRN